MIGEVLGDDVGVRQQDIADGLEGRETQEACERTVALRNAFHPQGERQHVKFTFANLFI